MRKHLPADEDKWDTNCLVKARKGGNIFSLKTRKRVNIRLWKMKGSKGGNIFLLKKRKRWNNRLLKVKGLKGGNIFPLKKRKRGNNRLLKVKGLKRRKHFPAKEEKTSKHPPVTLQSQNTEITKQIFPEKEYRGFSPNFHIHASVSDLYIPTICLPGGNM